MKLTTEFIKLVYDVLINSSITTEIHKDSKLASSTSTEYIVINSMDTEPDRMQKCYVNVNCYAKDLGKGKANISKLNSIAASVLNVIEEYNDPQHSYMIDCVGQKPPYPQFDTEHYINLKFSVKIIN